MFQNGAWSRQFADLVIFDDVFVTENIYAGLEVETEHRQNLHELILGAKGSRSAASCGTKEIHAWRENVASVYE